MPICYVTLRNVHRLQNGFSTFLCLEWRSAEIKWRHAWAVTERPKRLYFSLFSGRKTQGSISGWKNEEATAAAAQNCQSQILIHFSRSILPKNERGFFLNFEKIGWDVIPFALKRRKIESVKQVIWNITHRVKFCTISSLHGYFHHSSHFFLRIHRSRSREKM